METFHEVLPDNLVFFHFHYIGTKEIKPMDYTIVLYVKNCISEENYTSGVQTLPQTFRDQAVLTNGRPSKVDLKYISAVCLLFYL